MAVYTCRSDGVDHCSFAVSSGFEADEESEMARAVSSDDGGEVPSALEKEQSFEALRWPLLLSKQLSGARESKQTGPFCINKSCESLETKSTKE